MSEVKLPVILPLNGDGQLQPRDGAVPRYFYAHTRAGEPHAPPNPVPDQTYLSSARLEAAVTVAAEQLRLLGDISVASTRSAVGGTAVLVPPYRAHLQAAAMAADRERAAAYHERREALLSQDGPPEAVAAITSAHVTKLLLEKNTPLDELRDRQAATLGLIRGDLERLMASSGMRKLQTDVARIDERGRLYRKQLYGSEKETRDPNGGLLQKSKGGAVGAGGDDAQDKAASVAAALALTPLSADAEAKAAKYGKRVAKSLAVENHVLRVQILHSLAVLGRRQAERRVALLSVLGLEEAAKRMGEPTSKFAACVAQLEAKARAVKAQKDRELEEEAKLAEAAKLIKDEKKKALSEKRKRERAAAREAERAERGEVGGLGVGGEEGGDSDAPRGDGGEGTGSGSDEEEEEEPSDFGFGFRGGVMSPAEEARRAAAAARARAKGEEVGSLSVGLPVSVDPVAADAAAYASEHDQCAEDAAVDQLRDLADRVKEVQTSVADVSAPLAAKGRWDVRRPYEDEVVQLAKELGGHSASSPRAPPIVDVDDLRPFPPDAVTVTCNSEEGSITVCWENSLRNARAERVPMSWVVTAHPDGPSWSAVYDARALTIHCAPFVYGDPASFAAVLTAEGPPVRDRPPAPTSQRSSPKAAHTRPPPTFPPPPQAGGEKSPLSGMKGLAAFQDRSNPGSPLGASTGLLGRGVADASHPFSQASGASGTHPSTSRARTPPQGAGGDSAGGGGGAAAHGTGLVGGAAPQRIIAREDVARMRSTRGLTDPLVALGLAKPPEEDEEEDTKPPFTLALTEFDGARDRFGNVVTQTKGVASEYPVGPGGRVMPAALLKDAMKLGLLPHPRPLDLQGLLFDGSLPLEQMWKGEVVRSAARTGNIRFDNELNDVVARHSKAGPHNKDAPLLVGGTSGDPHLPRVAADVVGMGYVGSIQKTDKNSSGDGGPLEGEDEASYGPRKIHQIYRSDSKGSDEKELDSREEQEVAAQQMANVQRDADPNREPLVRPEVVGKVKNPRADRRAYAPAVRASLRPFREYTFTVTAVSRTGAGPPSRPSEPLMAFPAGASEFDLYRPSALSATVSLNAALREAAHALARRTTALVELFEGGLIYESAKDVVLPNGDVVDHEAPFATAASQAFPPKLSAAEALTDVLEQVAADPVAAVEFAFSWPPPLAAATMNASLLGDDDDDEDTKETAAEDDSNGGGELTIVDTPVRAPSPVSGGGEELGPRGVLSVDVPQPSHRSSVVSESFLTPTHDALKDGSFVAEGGRGSRAVSASRSVRFAGDTRVGSSRTSGERGGGDAATRDPEAGAGGTTPTRSSASDDDLYNFAAAPRVAFNDAALRLLSPAARAAQVFQRNTAVAKDRWHKAGLDRSMGGSTTHPAAPHSASLMAGLDPSTYDIAAERVDSVLRSVGRPTRPPPARVQSGVGEFEDAAFVAERLDAMAAKCASRGKKSHNRSKVSAILRGLPEVTVEDKAREDREYRCDFDDESWEPSAARIAAIAAHAAAMPTTVVDGLMDGATLEAAETTYTEEYALRGGALPEDPEVPRWMKAKAEAAERVAAEAVVDDAENPSGKDADLSKPGSGAPSRGRGRPGSRPASRPASRVRPADARSAFNALDRRKIQRVDGADLCAGAGVLGAVLSEDAARAVMEYAVYRHHASEVVAAHAAAAAAAEEDEEDEEEYSDDDSTAAKKKPPLPKLSDAPLLADGLSQAQFAFSFDVLAAPWSTAVVASIVNPFLLCERVNALRAKQNVALQSLKARLQQFHSLVWNRQDGEPPLRTTEGAFAVKEAIAVVEDMEPLHTLKISWELCRVAAEHAVDCAQRHSESHTGSDGRGPSQRVAKVGKFVVCAENLTHTPGDGATVADHFFIDDGMMNRGHRKNILDERWDVMGAGSAPSDSGAVYTVVVFAKKLVPEMDVMLPPLPLLKTTALPQPSFASEASRVALKRAFTDSADGSAAGGEGDARDVPAMALDSFMGSVPECELAAAVRDVAESDASVVLGTAPLPATATARQRTAVAFARELELTLGRAAATDVPRMLNDMSPYDVLPKRRGLGPSASAVAGVVVAPKVVPKLRATKGSRQSSVHRPASRASSTAQSSTALGASRTGSSGGRARSDIVDSEGRRRAGILDHDVPVRVGDVKPPTDEEVAAARSAITFGRLTRPAESALRNVSDLVTRE